MSGSTLTIRRDRTGKITSVTATRKYAEELFSSLKPVTVETKDPESKAKESEHD